MASKEFSKDEWTVFQRAIENAPLGFYQGDGQNYRIIPASSEPIVFSDWSSMRNDAHLVLSAVEKVGQSLGKRPNDPRLFLGLSPLESDVARGQYPPVSGLATARLDLFFDADQLWIIEVNCTIPAMQAYTDMVRQALFQSWKVPYPERLQANSDDLLQGLMEHYQLSQGKKSHPLIAIVARPGDAQTAELLWLKKRWESLGFESKLLTPDQIQIKNGEIWDQKSPIDLCYRHIFAHRLDAQSAFAEACRHSMRYRVFNPVSAHLEAKAVLAELSRVVAHDEDSKTFGLSFEERVATQKRVPWSRVLRTGDCDWPEGRGDLISYVKKERSSLVIKSNLGYGGRGVFVGPDFFEAESQERLRALFPTLNDPSWDAFIDACVQDPRGLWIAQKRASGRRLTHSYLADGMVHREETYIDASIFSATGIKQKAGGGACRFSKDMIVNLGKGGGLAPVLSENELRTLQTGR